MTREDEELLLIDLCARLPYKGKISIPGLWTSKEKVETLNEIFKGDDNLYRVNSSGMLIRYIKPYLFPLSSMTKEQKEELKYLCDWENDRWRGLVVIQEGEFCMNNEIIDWLNKNHFDYNRLIEKGLAIDATNLNIY